MAISGATLLIDPPLGSHIIYPYTEDDRMNESLSIYAGSGLAKNEAVVLFINYPRCLIVERHLRADGHDLRALKEESLFICVDAARCLKAITVNGMPDEARFRRLLEPIIRRAQGPDGKRSVRVFGEMVNILLAEKAEGALRLEELWNRFVEENPISLLCTYQLLGRCEPLPSALFEAHSHAVELS